MEYLTLVQCTEKLCTGLSQDPLAVCIKLFAKELVSDAQVRECLHHQNLDKYMKASLLVEAVSHKVQAFPKHFETFLEILDDISWLHDEVKDVRRKYKKNLNENLKTTKGSSDESIRSTVLAENISTIEGKYAILITNIAEKLDEMNISFRSFRLYIATFFPKQKHHLLSKASNVFEVFEILAGVPNWKFDSMSAVESVCKHFGRGDKSLRKMINDYKSELAGFRAMTKIVDYIKFSPSQETSQTNDNITTHEAMTEYDQSYCSKLSMKLNEKIKNESVSYIDHLWASLACYLNLPELPVTLQSICEGCIEVTWLVPTIIAQELDNQIEKLNEIAHEYGIAQIEVNDDLLYKDFSLFEGPVTEALSISSRNVRRMRAAVSSDAYRQANASRWWNCWDRAEEGGVSGITLGRRNSIHFRTRMSNTRHPILSFPGRIWSWMRERVSSCVSRMRERRAMEQEEQSLRLLEDLGAQLQEVERKWRDKNARVKSAARIRVVIW